MEPVGHLPGLRRALTGTFGVKAASVPADDLDAGMLSQPLAGGLGRPVRQHVDHLPPLQVDHDCPVAAALLPRPVVDPYDRDGLRGTAADMALEVPQDRIITLGEAEAAQQ